MTTGMKPDELAFLNQQLAGMLREGIPLEGALKQLCSGMQKGRLRTELEALQQDLAQGTPLDEAAGKRRLPDLYIRMLQLGAQSQNLPEVLLSLADYYQQTGTLGTRLKGLMVYPAIVLVLALCLSGLMAFLLVVLTDSFSVLGNLTWNPSGGGYEMPWGFMASIWMPSLLLLLVAIATAVFLAVPPWRRAVRWRLPGFKEANLAQLAGLLQMLLHNGASLSKALNLAGSLERATPMQTELGTWNSRLAEGNTRFSELAQGGKIVPPLFVWLVSQNGDNLADGFRCAAEVYQARANHRIEMLLYAALPVAVLFLGILISAQLLPIIDVLTDALDMIGAF